MLCNPSCLSASLGLIAAKSIPHVDCRLPVSSASATISHDYLALRSLATHFDAMANDRRTACDFCQFLSVCYVSPVASHPGLVVGMDRPRDRVLRIGLTRTSQYLDTSSSSPWVCSEAPPNAAIRVSHSANT